MFAEAIKAAGAMAVLLKDAIMPNVLQTIEHVPTFVHAGPFANIAHGNSSILADEIALRCADYVVTEAGFGADMGFEKFCNIKCRTSGRRPTRPCWWRPCGRSRPTAASTTSCPAGRSTRPSSSRTSRPCGPACPTCTSTWRTSRKFNLPCVVAINRFPSDSDEEIAAIADAARQAGAFDVAVSEVHTKGGAGRRGPGRGGRPGGRCAQAEAVPVPLRGRLADQEEDRDHRHGDLRRPTASTYEPAANAAIESLTRLGFDKLPICMAKTQYSLSHDPNRRGRPTGFTLPVRDIRLAGGAGFLTPLVGTIQTMPAFGRQPAAMNMDIDENGRITGLF